MSEEAKHASSTNTKEAQKVIGLNDIAYNPENNALAIVSCIPIFGLIVFFIEKKDLFVRYYAAQFMIILLAGIIPILFLPFLIIPIIGGLVFLLLACVIPILSIGFIVLIVVGMIKASKGERFDIPILSEIAISLMNAIK